MDKLKEPTVEQQHIIRKHMLLPDNWQVQEETEQELIVKYKHGKKVKRLKKDEDLWKGVKNERNE